MRVVVNNAQFFSVVADARCVVPEVGWGSCVAAQAIALAIRSKGEHGSKLVIDVVVSAGTLGVGRILTDTVEAARVGRGWVAYPRFKSSITSNLSDYGADYHSHSGGTARL